MWDEVCCRDWGGSIRLMGSLLCKSLKYVDVIVITRCSRTYTGYIRPKINPSSIPCGRNPSHKYNASHHPHSSHPIRHRGDDDDAAGFGPDRTSQSFRTLMAVPTFFRLLRTVCGCCGGGGPSSRWASRSPTVETDRFCGPEMCVSVPTFSVRG